MSFPLFLLQTPPPEAQPPSIEQLLERVNTLEQQVVTLNQQLQTLQNNTEQKNPDSPAPPAETKVSYNVQDQIIRQENALLLPPGKWEVEPSFTYAYSSNKDLTIDGFTILPVLIIGEITSENVRNTSVQSSLNIRTGLPDDMQIDVRIPYQWESRNTVNTEFKVSDQTISGFGDLEIGLSKQILKGKAGFPDLLLRSQWKSATGSSSFDTKNLLALGTGFQGLRNSITFVKSTDPAVLFGSIGYTMNFPDTKATGFIDPGNTFDWSLGAGIALSQDLSLTFGLEQRFTSKTKINQVSLAGSNLMVGSFLFGMSYRLNSQKWMNLNLSLGLTSDAPDFQLTTSMPISF